MELECGDIFCHILARLFPIGHLIVAVWRVITVTEEGLYSLIAIVGGISFLLELCYILGRREGKQFKWITLSSFIFIVAMVPCLIILEMDKIDRHDQLLQTTNITQQKEALVTIVGISFPFEFEPDTWLQIVNQCFVFQLVISRWLLPRGKFMSYKQLTDLLFRYIGTGSDVMEILTILDVAEIRDDEDIKIATLVIWALSLFQFCIVLTVTKGKESGNWAYKNDDCIDKMFQTEAWQLWVSIFIQDIPFLCLRIYVMSQYQVYVSGIIFFALKNGAMIILVIYTTIVYLFFPHSKASGLEDDNVVLQRN